MQRVTLRPDLRRRSRAGGAPARRCSSSMSSVAGPGGRSEGRLAIRALCRRRTRTGRMAPRAGRRRLHSRRHGVAGVSEACLAVLMPANPPGRPPRPVGKPDGQLAGFDLDGAPGGTSQPVGKPDGQLAGFDAGEPDRVPLPSVRTMAGPSRSPIRGPCPSSTTPTSTSTRSTPARSMPSPCTPRMRRTS